MAGSNPMRMHVLSNLYLDTFLLATLPTPNNAWQELLIKATAGWIRYDGDWRVDPDPKPDVLVLAGDIAAGTEGVYWAIRLAEGLERPVIYVPGNHEYRKPPIGEQRDYFYLLERFRKLTEGTAVYLLDCDEVVINGVRFLGATLWTDFCADRPTPQRVAMEYLQYNSLDFRQIIFNGRPFTPSDALSLHIKARSWLAGRLAQKYEGKTVVVTHHGPSRACVPAHRTKGPVASMFTSDMEDMMNAETVDAWICSAVARCMDVRIGGARLVVNARGSPGPTVNPGYDYLKMIEL